MLRSSPAGPAGVRGLRSGCDEVDELLDPAEQLGLEVGVRVDAGQDPLPRPRDVRLVLVRPAERLADAVLPLDAARDVRPGLDADPRGPHRLPDVDVGVAHDEHVAAIRTAL